MVVLQREVFEVAELTRQMEYENTGYGALVTFSGFMRPTSDRGEILSALEIEYYSGMTSRALDKVIVQAKQQFKIQQVVLVHRFGIIKPSEPIVFVGVTSDHRKDAFDACQMIMDYLKNDAPFWKKEILQNGDERWIEQKQSDRQMKQRWNSIS